MTEWTNRHALEAVRRTFELCAELVGDRKLHRALELREACWNIAQKEQTWRADLGSAFDAERIEREVRRVRDLAEGRLIRETVRLHVVPVGDHDVCSTEQAAVQPFAEEHSTPIRHITVHRIRRARG